MPQLVIRTTDAALDVAADPTDYVDVDAAFSAAVEAAIAIVAEEAQKGATQALVEVSVEEPSGAPLARGIVALSAVRQANC